MPPCGDVVSSAAPSAADRSGRERGLSSDEVAARVRAGAVNATRTHTSRSWAAIVRANVLTRFNALLGGLLVVILVIGPFQDALFGVILLVNTAIGVVQEVRARRTLDRLALLSEPRARVLRDGTVREVAREEVVIDDVLVLGRGDQVVADGIVLGGDGLEIDESLLTGEAAPVAKGVGEKVLSGSAVVAGAGAVRAVDVGPTAFAQSLADEARRFSLVRSELQEANNRILQLVTWAIVPVAALLCWSQLSGPIGVADALRGSVAGVANMVPEGLVLLTSMAYGLGALRLARRRALVRELAAVEGLARVDVLCIDKTGTLTTGELTPLEVAPLDASVPVGAVLAAMAATEASPSASLAALAAGYDGPVPAATANIPFSSERRWSAASFAGWGSFVLGAPEILAPALADTGVSARVAAETARGHRVLLLARTHRPLGDALPRPLEPVALAILAERVRPDAAETLRFLTTQGVAVKVISGDSPTTVAAVASEVGLDGTGVDASALPLEPGELAPYLEAHQVFGRVSPLHKRAMVAALQSVGHVVAMTGDGVNDVLALHDADLGIAMGSGSPASRSAARVVLLDDAFSSMPILLAEGRRVLSNVERVSKLFVSKTVYATLLALAIGISGVPYPFYPRHFTVVSTLTIGVPSFFLAFAPAATRLRSGYSRRVARFTVPAGIVIAAATLTTYLIDRSHDGGTGHARTAAALTLGTVGLVVLARVCRPWAAWKALLVAAMAGGFALAFTVPLARHLLAFRPATGSGLLLAGTSALVATVILEALWRHRPSEETGGDRLTEPGP